MLAKHKGKQLVQEVNIKSRQGDLRSILNLQELPFRSQESLPTINNFTLINLSNIKFAAIGSLSPLTMAESMKLKHVSHNASLMPLDTQKTFSCQTINVTPKIINYATAINLNNSAPSKPQHPKTVHIPFRSYVPPPSVQLKWPQRQKKSQIKKLRQNKKMPFFINPADWRIDPEEGSLILMNQEWKSNTLKIFAFVLKKFVTTGTFMGISFPVFAMKPQSILQTYAKSLASAPNIITNTRDQLQRFKQFTSLLWAFSLLQVAIVKPFNPVIGETFQADISGGKYSAQQVCHHPPISAFYYQKDNYKIHGALQLSASIGMNSGEGRFIGDITIEYDDKYWIKGKLPNGELTGVLFGTTTFQTFGGSYIYDSRNLVLTYNLGKNNIFEGFLGFLNYETSKRFQETLKDKDRFLKFKGYSQQQYNKVVSRFTAKYTQWVAFDNKIYQNLNDPNLFPYEIQQPQGEEMLKSDSRNRKDIQLLKQKQIQQSQQEKERIQNQERLFRKLRQQNAK